VGWPSPMPSGASLCPMAGCLHVGRNLCFSYRFCFRPSPKLSEWHRWCFSTRSWKSWGGLIFSGIDFLLFDWRGPHWSRFSAF
jgi:hypothetical protein